MHWHVSLICVSRVSLWKPTIPLFSYLCNHTIGVTQKEQIQSFFFVCWLLQRQVPEMNVLVRILHDHYFSGKTKKKCWKGISSIVNELEIMNKKWHSGTNPVKNPNNPTLKQLRGNELCQLCHFPPIALPYLSAESKQTTSASQCGLRPTLTHVLYRVGGYILILNTKVLLLKTNRWLVLAPFRNSET